MRDALRTVADAQYDRRWIAKFQLLQTNPWVTTSGLHPGVISSSLDEILAPPPMHNPNDSFGHGNPEYHSSSAVDPYWPAPGAVSAASAFTGQNENALFTPDPHAGRPNVQRSFSSYPQSSVPSGFASPDQRVASNDSAINIKVAIPRLAAPTTSRARRRSPRACNPCRQRKIKCDGVRPTCGQCAYHNNRCVYEDVKRVRDQKMLELLSKRAERYESLLRDLEGDVDAPTARRIRKALKVKSYHPNPISQFSSLDLCPHAPPAFESPLPLGFAFCEHL